MADPVVSFVAPSVVLPAGGDAAPERIAVDQQLDAIARVLSEAGPQAADRLLRAVQALRASAPLAPSTRAFDTLLTLVQWGYESCSPALADAAGRLAVQVAHALAEPALVRRALSVLGVLKADAGDFASATECYAEALDLAVALQDPAAQGHVLNNLGVALMYAAHYRDAIACFRRVLALANDQVALRHGALANIAKCCLHLDDHAQGLQAGQESEQVATQAGGGVPPGQQAISAMSRAIGAATYARLLLAAGRRDEAQPHVACAREAAAVSGSARATWVAAIADGLHEVASGRADVGLRRLDRVLQAARTDASMLSDALTAVIAANESAGRPDVALVHLRELIAVTRETERARALARHREHLRALEERLALDAAEAGERNRLERKEQALRGRLAEQIAAAELLRARTEMLERLAVTAELREESSGEHAYRVARLASLLARDLGEDPTTAAMIEVAARLHDVGKISVPDGILLKRGSLNDAEIRLMQSHCTVGAELLAESHVPQLRLAEDIARFHHEWWDGSGYPFGIGGTAIPRAARMVALADVFDALTHRRPYKPAWSVERTLDYVSARAGVQFDPEMAERFVSLVERLLLEVEDLDAYLGEAARESTFLIARRRIARALAQPAGDDHRAASPASARPGDGATATDGARDAPSAAGQAASEPPAPDRPAGDGPAAPA